MMKAVVYTQYGPPEVLQVKQMEKPTPKPDEIRIKVFASAVTTGDCNARGFVFVPSGLGFVARLMFGLRQPTKPVLGTELAGEVEAIGKDVTSFKIGDRVFGTTEADLGAYAEYVCRPEASAVAPMPANLSYAEAAAVPFGAVTALLFLRDKAEIQEGQKVLINGASGGVGTYAVQLARHFGADVTGVCSSANLDLVKSLGAHRVIDYTKQDFTSSGETYDIIFDMVGNCTFSGCKGSLKENGRFLAGAGGLRELLQVPWTSLTGSKKVLAGPAIGRKQELNFLRELIEAGSIRPVIDRSYPLEQIVEAHRYVDQGHKKGNVVVLIAHEAESA